MNVKPIQRVSVFCRWLALVFFLTCVQLASAEVVNNVPPVPDFDGQIIKEIRFVGNRITRKELLEQEIVVSVGDFVDLKQIEISRQAIMDLGLFKKVSADLLPLDDGLLLQLTVSEKYYILPIPRLNRNGDGDITFGGQLRWDNMAGLNQRLDVTWEREIPADSDINETDELEFEYRYPRIVGTPYQFDFKIDFETTQDDVVDEFNQPASYDLTSNSVRILFSRWAKRKGPSRGWRYGGGLARSETSYDHISGPTGLLNDGTLVSFNTNISFTDVHDNLYSRSGREYGYEFSLGLPDMGSDQSFTTHSLFYRGYIPVFNKPHQNLNIQLRLGFSNLEGEGAFSLGGSSSLRGYDRSDLIGNARFVANIEYLMPFNSYYPFRALAFADVGNTYPSLSQIDLTDVVAGVGLGIRWKLKSFVKTDLRLDFAYAMETGETKTIVTTRETF